MAKVKHTYVNRQSPFYTSLKVHGVPWYSLQDLRGPKLVGSVYLGDSPRDWATRIKLGLDASSELVGYSLKASQEGVAYRHEGLKGPVAGYDWNSSGATAPYGNTANLGDPPLVPLPNAANNAAMAIMRAYRNTIRKFGGATFLAELAETIRFFKNPAQLMFKKTVGFYRYADHMKVKFALKRPHVYREKVGEAWLTYKFGIAPLCEDMKDAAALASEAVNDIIREHTKPIFGFGSETSVVSLDNDASDTFCPYARQEVRTTLTSSVKYYGKVSPMTGVPGDWAALSGMDGLSDILPAVWEGTTASFLVDYFTNVGDVLQRVAYGNITPYLRYCTRGVENTYDSIGSPMRFTDNHPDVLGGYIKGYCSGGSFHVTRTTKHRTSGMDLPPVTLAFSLPGSKQVFNIAALIAATKRM